MRRPRTTALSLFIAVTALAAAAYALRPQGGPPAPGPEPAPSSGRPLLKPAPAARSIIPADAESVRVKSVADGDTITLHDGRKVRYLGIDTPEHGEPFFDEAKRFNSSMVLDRTLYIELDVEKQDDYGRYLAYVYARLDDGEEKLVNAEILRLGLARLYTFPPNLRHVETLRACQKEAIEAGRGTWKNYVFNSEPYFAATPGGRAYHRPSCKQIAGARKDTLIQYADARQALDAGRSPCRLCKP